MSELTRDLYAILAETQKSKDLTQFELAEKYDACPANINQDDWTITMQTLEKLASKLELSPVDLLNFRPFNINEHELTKQKKLKVLLNIIQDFNEYEITRIIKIVEEIKHMHR